MAVWGTVTLFSHKFGPGKEQLTLILSIVLSQKCHLLSTPAAYVEMHF